jgi:hypothetical protein
MDQDLIVLRSVSLQNIVQVRLAEHDEVIERCATDRSDEPLNMPVLPRRARYGRVIADSHCMSAANVRWTECRVAVAKQVTWHFIPGKGFDHLTSDPLGGRIGVTPTRPRGRPGRTTNRSAGSVGVQLRAELSSRTPPRQRDLARANSVSRCLPSCYLERPCPRKPPPFLRSTR